MSPLPLDGEHKAIRTGKNGTGTHTDASHFIIADQMQPDNAIDLLHCPCLNHWPGTTNLLLRWLEDKFNVPSQFRTPLAQNISYGQQNRGVPIVSAGMHFAIDLRAIVDIVHL